MASYVQSEAEVLRKFKYCGKNTHNTHGKKIVISLFTRLFD